MRFVMRLLAFVVVILAAFWFTARNANELVNVVLPFLRIRASLPLVVFACILGGMGISGLLAWRAERRAERLANRAASARLAYGPPVVAESPAAVESLAAVESAAAVEAAPAVEHPAAAEPPSAAEPPAGAESPGPPERSEPLGPPERP